MHGGAELPHSLQEEKTIRREVCQKPSREKVDCAKSIFPHQKEKDVILCEMQEVRQPFSLKNLERKDITVVTNSIHHAVQLVDKQIPTVIIGGGVKMTTDASIGGVALNQINEVHFDRAFIGMNPGVR